MNLGNPVYATILLYLIGASLTVVCVFSILTDQVSLKTIALQLVAISSLLGAILMRLNWRGE